MQVSCSPKNALDISSACFSNVLVCNCFKISFCETQISTCQVVPDDVQCDFIASTAFGMDQEIPDYDMDSEDEAWLTKQTKKMEVTALQFENMMDRLEKGSGQVVRIHTTRTFIIHPSSEKFRKVQTLTEEQIALRDA